MSKRDIRNTNLRQFPETAKEDLEVIRGEERWMVIYLMGQGRNLYSSTEEYSTSRSFIITSHGDNFSFFYFSGLYQLAATWSQANWGLIFFSKRNSGKILEEFSRMFEETWGIISGNEELSKI